MNKKIMGTDKISIVISENDKVIETVSIETSTDTSQVIKSLEKFQCMMNQAITKMIDSSGDLGGEQIEDESEDDSDSDDDKELVSPKKRKNN